MGFMSQCYTAIRVGVSLLGIWNMRVDEGKRDDWMNECLLWQMVGWNTLVNQGLLLGTGITGMRLCTFYKSCMLHCNHMEGEMTKCVVVSRIDKNNASL
jgi:hypothetical protein